LVITEPYNLKSTDVKICLKLNRLINYLLEWMDVHQSEELFWSLQKLGPNKFSLFEVQLKIRYDQNLSFCFDYNKKFRHLYVQNVWTSNFIQTISIYISIKPDNLIAKKWFQFELQARYVYRWYARKNENTGPVMLIHIKLS